MDPQKKKTLAEQFDWNAPSEIRSDSPSSPAMSGTQFFQIEDPASAAPIKSPAPTADDYSLGALSSFASPSNIASGLWEGTKAIVTSPWNLGAAIGNKYAENEYLESDDPQLQALLKTPGPGGDEARRMVAEARTQRAVVGDIGGAAIDYGAKRGPWGVARDVSMAVPIVGPLVDRAIGDAEFAVTGKPTETADQQAQRFWAGQAPIVAKGAGELASTSAAAKAGNFAREVPSYIGNKLGVFDPNTGNMKIPFTRNPSELGGSSRALGSGDIEGGKGAQVTNKKITEADHNSVLNASNGLLRAEARDPNLVAVYDPQTTGIKFQPAAPDVAQLRAAKDPLSLIEDNAARAQQSAKAAKDAVIQEAGESPLKINQQEVLTIGDKARKLDASSGETGVGVETLKVFDDYQAEIAAAKTIKEAEAVRERLGADLANNARAYETTGRSPWSQEAVAIGNDMYHLLGDAINDSVNLYKKSSAALQTAGDPIPENFIARTNAIIHTMSEARRYANARVTKVMNQAESLSPVPNAIATSMWNFPKKIAEAFTGSPEYRLGRSADRAIQGARGYRQRTGQEPRGAMSRGADLLTGAVQKIAAIPRDLRIVLAQPELVGMKIQQEVGQQDPNAAMQIATDVVQKLKDPNVQEDTKRGIVMGLAIQFPSIFTPAPHGLQSVWRGELLSQPDRRKYMSLVQKSPDTPPDVKAKIISAAVQGQFLDIGTPTVEAGVDPAGFTPNMSLDDIPDPTMGLPPSTMQSSPNPEEIPGMTAGPRTMDMLNRMNINNDYLQ